VAGPAALQDFDFLFPTLQNNQANLLPQAATTPARLKDLGRTMVDPGAATGDSTIPAIYTYFGQFVDHDITLESGSFTTAKLLSTGLVPLGLATIRNDLKNLRTATLELDSLYGPPAPRTFPNLNKMLIGRVTSLQGTEAPSLRPSGKGDDNDLPREPRSPDFAHDRAARIGDPRNDENLIVAQLHLAFLKAHNRFGHTMIRDDYDFNLNFNRSGDPGTFPADLGLLFTFTALSGELGDFDTLPDNWIIEWERFVDTGTGAANKARKFDTKLAGGLFHLQSAKGQEETPADAARLAVRNLLRGYGLRMPTGQAIANHLGITPLTATQLKAAAASTTQASVLQNTGFLTRTPLWYYLLAEAKHHGGQRLGPVGSTIVGEVLIGLVRRSDDSILRTPGWTPTLPAATPGRFELADLLRFAKVLP